MPASWREDERLSQQPEHPLAKTELLLGQARSGDDSARAEVLHRYREPLARLLHGRLSPAARSSMDTEDVVQEVLTTALQRLGDFEYRGLGSFWAYLRRIGINLIHSEGRRRVGQGTLDTNGPAGVGSSPSSVLARREALEAFEAALEREPEQSRGALLLRLELGLPYELVARECGYPSADAARMAIGRTMARMAKELAAFEP